jgi:putative ABC transport system permease protein
MWKITRRSLWARKWRFLLTVLAVTLGVSFVTASFVLSDSLRSVFGKLSDQIAAPVDVAVRGRQAFGNASDLNAQRPPVPESLIGEVAAVPGVKQAVGSVGGNVNVTTLDGKVVKPAQAPSLGFSWEGPERSISAFELLQGTAPSGPGEVAIDKAQADSADLKVGDQIRVSAAGGQGEFTISGLVRFGNEDSTGAYYVLFDLPTAQDIFGMPGQLQQVSAQADEGVNQQELRDRVADALPDYDVITGQQVGEEFSDSFGQIINIFRNALLAFALVTLFVAGVLIGNVFTITLGQRVRELALLRAVGARWSQLMRSVVVEALLIGFAGSIVGVVAGLGVASLINALLSSSGGGLPTGSLVVTATTWVVALVVGVGLTLLLSVVPAWRAGRVPPIAALREGYSMSQGKIRWRIVRGVVAIVIGGLALVTGLFGSADTAPRLALLVIGAILIFFGVSRLTPLVARPAALGLGWPFRRFYGVSGEMARGNAARNPLRTASTATALMIGLALVSMASVVGASFKDSFTEQIDRGITADYFLSTDNNVTGFSPDVTTTIAAQPVVDTVGTFRFGQAQVDGKTKSLAATQPEALERVVNLGITSGGPQGLADNGVMVQKDPAEDLGLSVGDTVDMTFPVGGTKTMTVVGIYTDDVAGLGNWIISQSTFADHYPPDAQLDTVGGFTIKPGSDPAQVKATVDQLSSDFPEVKIQDRAAFKASQKEQIDQLLVVINALLAMSLFVAVLGIAITLALSVFERTRELGLLRAIGQHRRQTRRMVRLEAVIVAVFGALLGLLLGLVFGLAITASLPRSVITVTTVPFTQLIIVLVVAALAGVVAALWPAWRAGRLRILDAIAYE